MTTVKLKVIADPGNTKQTTAEIESSFDKMSAGIAGIFAGLASQVGDIFGGIADQLNNVLDIGKSQDKLAAQLGLTGEEAAKYGQIAGDLYKGAWGESLDDVNNTIANVTRNIGEGNEEWLKQTAALTMDFASAFEEDAQGITTAIATMLNTGVAKSSEEAFDILTKGMQTGANKGQDLLDTFTEYSTIFRGLGLSGEEAMGLINQGLEGGARNADVVADALKEFQIIASSGTEAAAYGFETLGFNAEEMTRRVAAGGESSYNALNETLNALRNMTDPVTRNAAAVALFGTKAEDLGEALFSMDPESAADALGDVTGAAQKMSDTLNDNAATKIEAFKRQALMGIADLIVNKVVPAVQGLIAIFISTGEFIIQYKEIFIALGVGILAAALPAIVTLTAALWAKAAALAANVVATAALLAPYIAVAAAIAALVAAVIWAYQNWDWFRQVVDGFAHFFKDILWPILKAVGSWIITNFVPIIVTIATTVADIAVKIYNAFEGIVSFIWGLPGRIADAASGMWNGIVDAFKWAINQIIRLWNAFDLSIPGVQLPGWMGGMGWGGISDLIPDIPYLDTGGILVRDTLAMVHKNEAVVPLPPDWRQNGLGGAGTTMVVMPLGGHPRRTGARVRRMIDQGAFGDRTRQYV